MSIGENLRKLRGTRSLKEVANALNVSKSAVAMYERDERTPRDEIKKRIAKYYGVTVQDIFFA